MESDKVTLRGACVQILATFSIAFLALLSGMLFTWPSYNVAKFVANETVLSEPMNSLHVSLLGSLMNIGSIFVTPIFGWAMNKIGPKLTLILVGIPFVIGWIIMCITNSVIWILCAVTIAGCGTAGQASGAIYVSEIAHYSIRGALTSSLLTIYFLGVLLSYVLGGYLTYYQIVYVQLGAAIFNLVMLSFLKDSPVYLLQIGKEKAATESVAFYRQLNPKSKQVQAEIANIKLQLNPRLDKNIDDQEDPTVTKDLLPTEEPPQLTGWQFLKQSPSSIRAFITSLLIMATTILMGNVPMQVYAETLFAEALPSYNPNTCSIWLAVVFVIATLVCVMVIDRLGRKFLTIFSCTTSSICTLILGTQTQFKWASEWFTMLVIYLYNFFFNMGIAIIPYVLIGEVFLPEVRGLCGGITVSSGFALNFMITLIFTPVVENYGFTSLFYGFTLIGFAGTVFALFCLPETKELSVDVIQALFLKKTKRKIDA